MNTLKSVLLFLFILIVVPSTLHGAFPLKSSATIISAADTNKHLTFVPKTSEPKKEIANKRQWIAIVLAVFPFGFHRLYLGYNTIGLIQCATPILAILGAVTLYGGAPVLALLFLLAAYGMSIWIFVDLIRICFRNLKPKNGEYK